MNQEEGPHQTPTLPVYCSWYFPASKSMGNNFTQFTEFCYGSLKGLRQTDKHGYVSIKLYLWALKFEFHDFHTSQNIFLLLFSNHWSGGIKTILSLQAYKNRWQARFSLWAINFLIYITLIVKNGYLQILEGTVCIVFSEIENYTDCSKVLASKVNTKRFNMRVYVFFFFNILNIF